MRPAAILLNSLICGTEGWNGRPLFWPFFCMEQMERQHELPSNRNVLRGEKMERSAERVPCFVPSPLLRGWKRNSGTKGGTENAIPAAGIGSREYEENDDEEFFLSPEWRMA